MNKKSNLGYIFKTDKIIYAKNITFLYSVENKELLNKIFVINDNGNLDGQCVLLFETIKIEEHFILCSITDAIGNLNNDYLFTRLKNM